MAVGAKTVMGQTQTCTVVVTPQILAPGASANLQFQIDNTGTQPTDTILWIKITRPSTDYTVQSGSIDGWDDTTEPPTHTTQTGSYLDPGDSLTADVSVNTGGAQSSSIDWLVQASYDQSGVDSFICGGELGTSISTPDSATQTDPDASNNKPLNTKVPQNHTPTEGVPPEVSLDTSFGKPFKQTPKITGKATDNEALAGVEYSIDGGQNWLPVDKDEGLGGKSATFEFTPINLDDGNYQLLARAIDTSGNIGTTKPATMVIDRLEPIAGPPLVSIGPLVLEPGGQGIINSQVGVDHKVTLSAVGGPISIDASAQKTNESRDSDKNFTLTQSPESGLWAGIMSFEEPGLYKLVVQSEDGAGNKTERTLASVNALPASKISEAGSTNSVPAELTIYYLEPESDEWVVWDGAAYNQKNPQLATADGGFSYFLPSGKYYLKAAAGGYGSLTTNIFEFETPTPLSAKLEIRKAWSWQIGSLTIAWPSFSIEKIKLDKAAVQAPQAQSLINKSVPDFSLGNTNGAKTSSVGLLGKPTVLTFLSTWSPTTAEQLNALSEMQVNGDLNVLPITVGENAARLRAYAAVSGLELDWLADPDSGLVSLFSPQSQPMHYFIDRKGLIQKIIPGVLSKDEITDNLSGL